MKCEKPRSLIQVTGQYLVLSRYRLSVESANAVDLLNSLPLNPENIYTTELSVHWWKLNRFYYRIGSGFSIHLIIREFKCPTNVSCPDSGMYLCAALTLTVSAQNSNKS